MQQFLSGSQHGLSPLAIHTLHRAQGCLPETPLTHRSTFHGFKPLQILPEIHSELMLNELKKQCVAEAM